MIHIFSHHTTEFTTEMVMDWLTFYNNDYIRVNGLDLLDDMDFGIQIGDGSDMKIHSSTNIESCKVFWYRRWMEKRLLPFLYQKHDSFFDKDTSELFKSEFDGLTNSFFYALRDFNWDNKPSNLSPYPIKLEQLREAKEAGFSIPQTLITNNKATLKKFKLNNNINEMIIKPIKEVALIGNDEGSYCTYTSKIRDSIDELPDHFFPSLFQEMIEKQNELRVFFYNGNSYTMAIFSHLDSQTAVDFRLYNHTKPNRTVPYKLPRQIEEKIKVLMANLNLTTGSLDFILSKNNDFVFLEVNPVGQFGMVSIPCNYYLEKIVAQNLISQS